MPGNHDVYTRGAARDAALLSLLRSLTWCPICPITARGTKAACSRREAARSGGFHRPFHRARRRPPSSPRANSATRSSTSSSASCLIRGARKRTPVICSTTPCTTRSHLGEDQARRLDGCRVVCRVFSRRSIGASCCTVICIAACTAKSHESRALRRHRSNRRASLVHESAERMAGFNLYELSNDGLITAIDSYLYDEKGRTFASTALPRTLPPLADARSSTPPNAQCAFIPNEIRCANARWSRAFVSFALWSVGLMRWLPWRRRAGSR